MQHGCAECTDRREDRTVQVRCAELHVEQSEISQRVLQQGIVALEFLRQTFLASDCRCQFLDRGHCSRVGSLDIPQSAEGAIQLVHFPDQGIVVVQQPGPGAQHIPTECRFGLRKVVESRKGPIEQIRIRVHSLQ
jgi:hypothetical protein